MARKVYLGIGGKSRAVKKMYVAPKPLNNLISDGMMEPGNWSGGTQDTAHVAFGSYSMRMNGQSGSPEALLTSAQSIALSPSHIYYAAVHAYQTTLQGSVDIYWPIAEPAFMVGKALPAANQWCRISGRNGRSSFSGSHPIRFDYNNSNAVGTMWFDGPMLIDLTAEFGAGSEPDQDWCDKNIVLGAGGDAFVKPNASIPAQSTARKIKKGYVGIGDVARPFFGHNPIEYNGTTPVGLGFEGLCYLSGATAAGEGYAIVAGGKKKTGEVDDQIQIYAANLQGMLASPLDQARYWLSGGSVGKYAVFAGGATSATNTSSEVDAYDGSLTKLSPTNLSNSRCCMGSCSTSDGNYLLFAGGMTSYSVDALNGDFTAASYTNRVNAYNTSLTRTTPSSLSQSKSNMGGAVAGDYSVFCGGFTSSGASDIFEAYNTNLTRTTLSTSLFDGRGAMAGASAEGTAFFAGGSNGTTITNLVHAVDSNLTVTAIVGGLRYSVWLNGGVEIGPYALFVGGNGNVSMHSLSAVDYYDKNRTVHRADFSLQTPRYGMGVARAGDVVFVAGGGNILDNTYATSIETIKYFPDS